MRVIYTVQSRHDLGELGDWIARDNPRRALSFVRQLRVRCRGLASYPARFPVIAERHDAQVRRCVHGDYVILFHIAVKPEAVVILGVVHGARDYNKLLRLLGWEDGD